MELGRRIASRLANATFDRVARIGLANAEVNRVRVGRSLLDLAETSVGTGDSAIVVGAGPSLHRRKSIERLRASGFGGTIVATDGALGACLRGGVLPHVVVSVDPHPDRIVRWFGDPTLVAPRADDYFRRQEADPAHAGDEVRANAALIALVDTHGPRISAAVATSVSPAVADRCEQAGMTLFWWNPLYDDYERPDSVSRKLHVANGLPCLNGGGNVGTAAWVMAHAALGKRRVGLLGFDLSYPPGQPHSQTQYYPELRELLGDRFEEAFIHLENPDTGETWFCDPAYFWFRQVFLEMAPEAACETVNCTEGGVLFGPGIKTASLEEFVNG
ncbi:MAG: DUF115 domain-containing protein [Dehalococcoidia bacterium]|nr:DUF115 domain-containing protein [Dehalococcoidia bacterium]